MKTNTLIFGHRGYPHKFVENSLDGFIYAIDHGVEGLEFDVHLTRDNVPIIMHDEKINRTTDGKGKINDYTLEELRQFHLKDGQKNSNFERLVNSCQSTASSFEFGV